MHNDIADGEGGGGMPTTEFGQHLRALRKARGLSLRQVEDITGIDRSRLSRWELGKQTPTRSDSTDTVLRLCQALGDKDHRLMQLAGLAPRDDVRRTRPPFRELILTERTLTTEQKRVLVSIYESWVGSAEAG